MTLLNNQSRSQAHPVQAIILLFGLLALVSIGIYQTIPPKPKLLSTPESAFSSARAMSHVRRIGAKPHPTGSPENAEVREYLISQIKALGLTPEIQAAVVVNPKTQQAVQIYNVLVKIPGTKPKKALLLSAHYDSVTTGPGAADDGASVAAILETLRALRTQPALQNDLVCLFTDSEESGLLGAHAFVEQHPWVKQIGLALNFEYRGNSGAFMMFETSDGNGKLIAGLAASVEFVMSNSLMYEVYQRLPNDTDFSVFKRAGILGMNFAAIEGHKAYHIPLDRPEFLGQGTLQHEGDIMMALVKHFGNQPLGDLKAENRIYFDFPGLGIIHYPMRWTVPLCALLTILFTALCVINHKAKTIRIKQSLISIFFYLLLVFGMYWGNSGLWAAIRAFHPNYRDFAYDDTFISYCYLLGFIVLNSVVMCVVYLWATRWLKYAELNLGIAAIWLLLALLTVNNGANFLFTWPLYAFLVALGLIRLPFFKNHPAFNALIVLSGSAPGILIFTPLIKNLFVGLTPSNMAVNLLFLNLLLGLSVPMLDKISTKNEA
jgi:hypothetical protein